MATAVETSINICLKIITLLEPVYPIKDYMINHNSSELKILFKDRTFTKENQIKVLLDHYQDNIQKEGTGFDHDFNMLHINLKL
jgi:hypothetical protein